MTTTQTDYRTEAAATTKGIKAKLRAMYPDVKFSVTRSNTTAWLYVNITWTDGPASESVAAVAGLARDWAHCEGILTHRRFSDEERAIAWATAQAGGDRHGAWQVLATADLRYIPEARA